MARISLETAQALVETIAHEHQQDRKILQTMLDHSTEMVGALNEMLAQEQDKLEIEFRDRKNSVRAMFEQLITNEQDRSERLAQQLTDLSGDVAARPRVTEVKQGDYELLDLEAELATRKRSGAAKSANGTKAH
ncbi:MAG: hypothetical protein GY948_11425 [Alphaproteobacteria bacterium]|nr:hypothetical protein [Alphaproteobacteria bacterium]